MAIVEFIAKNDFEQFKIELFAELRRPQQKLHKQGQQKEWLKSFEVRKLLSISAGTLQKFRNNGILKFNRIGGLTYLKYEDVVGLVEGEKMNK